MSAPAMFSMGILSPADWGSDSDAAPLLVGPTADIPKATCPWFRKTFTLPPTATGTALVYLASVGFQELYVNGAPAAPDSVLLPSVSYLPKRVLYRTYNVSALLNPGQPNVLAIWAAAGWGTYPDMDHGIATNAPLILAKLVAPGFTLTTDATWKVAPSNVISTGGGPGGGDSLDDSKAVPDWNTATFDDSKWAVAVTHPLSSYPNVTISADAMEPTRRESVVPAASVTMVATPTSPEPVIPQEEWWGPSSLRPKPAPRVPAPFCGYSGLDPGGTTTNYEKLQLSCPTSGDSIASIDFAVWGVPDVSESCSSWTAGDKCGSVPATTKWVESECVGKPTCTLDPIHHQGDPCVGKFKKLAVIATCKIGPGNATAINTLPPPPGPPTPPPPGTWLVTMAELYTGWFEVHNMTAPPGTTVKFQVSTTVGKTLEFGMQDSYTFGPSGRGSFRMRFAYHEIHFITITGLPTAPNPKDIVGYRLTSLGDRVGDFECSSELISTMYSTTVNNYRGLTTGGMSVDCPHRERRGYGGDGHTSYQFALANYPVGAFFNKWTRDFADVQGVPGGFGTPAGTGLVPNTAPTVGGGGGPAWGAYVVNNPWQTYNTFGDTTILEDMYPTMVKLLAFYASHTQDDGLLHPWDSSQWDFLGDWITPHGSESKVNSPENLLFNNCILHYITTLVSRISGILGDSTAEAKYAADAAARAVAINKAFGNASTGVFVDMLQTHAVMPLATGVVPPEVAPKTWSNLAHQITVVNTGHLDTGLTGTYFMTKLLMEAGRNDLIFTYANKTDFPSYGHFLALGYTTWPEQWDVANGQSLMHGCYNAIGLWFVEGVAGIRVHASEYPSLTIRAGVDAGDITWARGQRLALHGMAFSSWTLSSHRFSHNITVPAGGVAKVLIPSANGATGVTEGGVAVGSAVGVTVLGVTTVNKLNYLALQVLAGTYSFASTWSR
eukprot:m.97489 g.97489  ORF g.97489 m.97489 type:complete len:949 (+) comp12401_c0_seq2:373-3219(+)